MSVSHRKDLRLAMVPSSPAVTISDRAAPGLRFREARIQIPEGVKCLLKWRDFYGKEIQAHIRNLSRYGCSITLPQDTFSQKLFIRVPRAQIEIDNAIAYNGSIIFVNERQESDGSISAGITLEQMGCDLDTLSAAAGLRSLDIESDLSRVLSISQSVGENFKILVADLNTILQEVKQKLEIEENKAKDLSQSENHKMRLEERIITVALSIYGPKLQDILSKFQKVVSEMSVDEEIPHKQYFRLNFQALVRETPFVDRGLRKPLGYSGDYGMMVMLYEYVDQGPTLFSRFFHRFVCSEPAAVANRNRVGFLSDILLAGFEKAITSGSKDFTITSIACGPAREIYEFLKFAPLTPKLPVKLVLIDSEPHALDYAQARLRELSVPESSVKLVFLKEDAVTGTLQNNEFLSWVKDSDFIISAGLFDYLTDRVASKMISSLYQNLKQDGQILIGNISKKSPDIFAMDYFMDWRLILRDEPDLIKLVPNDPKNTAKVDVISESLGLNLFLRVKRARV